MRAVRVQAGYVTLVALLVATTVAAGAVLYQVFDRGVHSHAGAASAPVIAVTADAAGSAIMLLLALQLMSGYHLISVSGRRFRRLHVPVAWAIAAVLAFHTGSAVLHSLEPPIAALPLVLDGIGAVLLALVAAQIASGYRRSRPHAERARSAHALVALALVALVAGHAVLGVAHTVGG